MRMVSAFDKALSFCRKVDDMEVMKELWTIFCEDNFDELLDKLFELNYIENEFALKVLKVDIYEYDLDEDNYYEINMDKQALLFDIIFNGNEQELDEWYRKQEEE